jgi:hypothetical protein
MKIFVGSPSLSEIMDLRKQLNKRESFKQRLSSFNPIGRVEENITIEPRHLTATRRQGLQGYVEQTLLLPQDVCAMSLNENLRVAWLQLEIGPIAQFDGDQRDLQTFAENPIIC